MVLGSMGMETQAADLNKVNAVLANSDLTFPLLAGQRVSGTFYIPVNVGAIAAGIKWRLNVSSAPTYYVCGFCNNRQVTDTVWQWAITAQVDMTDPAPSLGLNYITGNFNIVANAAATVTLQFAQVVVNALATVMQQGAFVQYVYH
jgi:hypothetical protein